MDKLDYEKDLKHAREELAAFIRTREEIEVAIAKQKRKIAALSELCEESEFDEPANYFAIRTGLGLEGLSDACRTAMRASRKEWMTIAEIQETLKELGFPLHKYKAPAASITTTVNRFVDSKQAEIESRSTGGSVYKWIGTVPLSSLRGDRPLRSKEF